MTSQLAYASRPASEPPVGLLILHHGRGSDENDLIGVADVLDPQHRLSVIAPRGPLRLPTFPGYHWYIVPRVGFPDPVTFDQAYHKLAEFHDDIWQQSGVSPDKTVLGGFSMGSVMSYALGLSGNRPAPAGILAFSGFIPTVKGWAPSLQDRQDLRVFIAHGRRDPVMGLQLAHQARDLLTSGGLAVEYHEHEGGHAIDPIQIGAAVRWLGQAFGLANGDVVAVESDD